MHMFVIEFEIVSFSLRNLLSEDMYRHNGILVRQVRYRQIGLFYFSFGILT